MRTALQYGAYSGLSCFAFFLLLYYSGHNPLGKWSWLGAWIPIVFIAVGTKHFRDVVLDGYINYGKALSIGTLISAAAAITFSLLVYCFGSVIATSLAEMQFNDAVNTLEKGKDILGEEWYEKTMTQLEESKNTITTASIAFNDFFSKSLGGFIVSLIVAAFYKREKPFFEKSDNE